jgi:hypothetical protein
MGCAGPESLRCPIAHASSDQCAPSGHCSYGVHPNSKIEVCVKISGVVIGYNSFVAGDAQVTVCGFLGTESHMKVVKYVKMKPLEVVPLEMLSICDVHRRL